MELDPVSSLARRRRNRALAVPLLAAAAVASACGKADRQGGPAGGPPLPVEVVTLTARPVERATEFVGTVKSRRSTTVQPQVEGFVTRILVHSGDRVRPGTPLVEIDVRMQQAAVASLDSQRAARQADVDYARQQAKRMKTLLAAGAASQAELEQAETALASGEAQLRAIEAQVREQSVALAYHRVSAPVAGVVGDVPVRVGDSVTKSTLLTTIDENAGLEVYVNVPVQEASALKPGLPVHLLDEQGRALADEELSFVSPAVDPATQSILVKTVLRKTGAVRSEQFVRARIVWSRAPALTVPLVALDRINGQYFAFVVEKGDKGALVARQRAVEPGELVGNDYVVTSGLKPGEQVIVSGVQKVRDGAPVAVATPPAAAAGKGR
ncbi:MAG: efflux RND transporter periplasmic adaptor subunit [Betaproteobacteria bacterium]